MSDTLALRAARHAALSDPLRLMIVDELLCSDRAPSELLGLVDVPSNLLAHHLDVLEAAGLVSRHQSSGDGRRRYVHLERAALHELTPRRSLPRSTALFVCTHNSARSQLAAALWQRATGLPAVSAGTHPAPAIHPGAIAAAARAGLDVRDAAPRHLDEIGRWPELVVTVCDRAHEELGDDVEHLHWSVPDPVPVGTRRAFDAARNDLSARIDDMTTLTAP